MVKITLSLTFYDYKAMENRMRVNSDCWGCHYYVNSWYEQQRMTNWREHTDMLGDANDRSVHTKHQRKY